MDGVKAPTAEVLALRSDLHGRRTRRVGSLSFGDLCGVLRLGNDALWLLIQGKGEPGMALRCAWAPAPGPGMELVEADEGEITLRSALGLHRVSVTAPVEGDAIVRVVHRITPDADVRVLAWSRDLYPLGPRHDPLSAKGRVLASQRGLNTGLVFGGFDNGLRGTFFYLQDLTSLNEYFRVTGTTPDGIVGGDWPALGMLLPPAHRSPLLEGKEIVLSDAFLRFDESSVSDCAEEARVFIEHFGAIYPLLQKPAPEFRDWPEIAAQTRKDLMASSLAGYEEAGYRYLRSYVDAEEPDAMVQTTVSETLREYEIWNGEEPRDSDRLKAGIFRFFDPKLGTVRRYLSTVGPQKNANKVDSWYLYHPLKGLARLARGGDEVARELFVASMGYAIETAHLFHYEWPIEFDVESRMIETASRRPGTAQGQTDAGGLYAYVMMDAYDLTGEDRFLDEAKAALRATEGLEFELAYQTNLTSWGAAACLRTWKATGERFYLQQSLVFLASFFHNCAAWDSKIGKVASPTTFLAVTCLHDAPYLAPFECYESFCAFHEGLALAEDDLPPQARRLMAEFCRYALHRAWWFYPSNLKPTSLAHSPRNGVLSRDLAFPLEDLYVDGQPAGQVGQEVYAAGAAFAYTTRAFHRLEDGPTLFCEYPIRDLEIKGKSATFSVRGEGSCRARILGHATVKVEGEKAAPEEFRVPVGTRVEIRWR